MGYRTLKIGLSMALGLTVAAGCGSATPSYELVAAEVKPGLASLAG